MIGWHFYYFVTVILALLLPFVIYKKTKEWASFLFIFPIVYAIYSFMAPIAIIFGQEFMKISSSHLVWNKIFPIFPQDSPEIYYAHTMFLMFYFTWFLGFFTANHFRLRILPKELNLKKHGKIPLYMCMLPFVFMMAIAVLIGNTFGMSLLSIVNIYGQGTKVLYEKYGTFFKLCLSFWAVSVICYVTYYYTLFIKSSSFKRLYWMILAIHVILFCVFVALIGDRSLLLMFIGSYLVIRNIFYKHTRLTWKTTVFIVVIILCLSFIGSYRGGRFFELFEAGGMTFSLNNLIFKSIFSVESFAPYASMVFLVTNNLPLLCGKSFLFLAVSFVPRVLAPYRPPSGYVYTQYADYAGIGLIKQGFCFHHVSDWYWNFSILGPLIGGFLIGYLMGHVEKRAKSGESIFWVVGYSLLVGSLPVLLRAPIEGIRTIFYELWLLPFLIFVVAPKFISRISRR